MFHSSHNCLVRIEGRLSFDGAFERVGGEIQWLFWVNTVRAPLPPCSGSLTSGTGGGVRACSHEAPQVWTTPRGLLLPSQAEPLERGLHPQTPAQQCEMAGNEQKCSLTHRTLPEHLLCARHRFGLWGSSTEQNREKYVCNNLNM